MSETPQTPAFPESPLRSRLNEIIFGYETRTGKLFDLVLIIAIIISVAAVMLDSTAIFDERYDGLLHALEWFFTLVFTVEYLLRIYSSPQPRAYIFSFYGLIDLLSIVPTYITFIYPDSVYLIVIRILRVLRIFRILKLFRYIGEASILYGALLQARRKIFVFVLAVLTLMIVFGTLMFIVEGPEHGFTSIPKSIYWAIVTITTVGYGDITPVTALGQAIAALAMISGYAIIAVPTGIVGAELMKEYQRKTGRFARTGKLCPACHNTDHDEDARYCKLCGAGL